MKKSIMRMLLAALSLAVMLGMGSFAFAAEGDATFDNSTTLADGDYAISFEAKTSKVTLTCDMIHVKDGQAVGDFVTNSGNQTHVYVGELDNDAAAPAENDGSVAITDKKFTIPVSLGKEMTISVYTSSMGGKWTHYALPMPAPLAVTNTTGMFNVASAFLAQDGKTMTVTLNSDGYRNLYKGTYEEAVANGNNRDNWIAGVDTGIDNGKGKNQWKFDVPIAEGETVVPVVAISQSYLTKYENGENELERAFFPRQLELDAAAGTLVTGDYDQTIKVGVTNNVKMFKPGAEADLRIVGGPNSNNYGAFLTLHMESDAMDQVKSVEYSYKGMELTEGDEVVIPVSEGVTFAEIPVLPAILGDTVTLEFHSKNNDKWYKRDLTIDLAAKTATFDPYAGDVAVQEIAALADEAAAAEYAAAKATPEYVDLLIEAIQVQARTDSTDKVCAAAKAAWDALTPEQQDEVGEADYFARDTGDASKDDPLNTAPDKEKELLVVSFGTSFNDSRAQDIGGVEKALVEAFPDWAVRRAFTAQIIINHVQARDGVKIDNMDQALEKAVAAGVKELVVQPTHLMHGAEYDELVAAVETVKDKFDKVSIAEPLLGPVGADATVINADKEEAAQAAVMEAVAKAGADSAAALADAKTAIVFMGHGTSHDANVTYSQMQTQMNKLGYDNVFVGTVEGIPASTALPEVKKAVEAAGYTKVILRPLMVVAGDHANNDMAADEEGSWYYGFVNGGEFEVEGADAPVNIGAGLGAENVTCQIEGLGRIPAIQQMYVAHSDQVINPPVAQVLKVKANNKKFTVKALSEKAKTFKAVTVKGKKGKLTYKAKPIGKKAKKALKFKNGKITVKKGTKKGTYKMKVTVKAAATDGYLASKAVTKTVKVVVKK